jgi:hypothetical protein
MVSCPLCAGAGFVWLEGISHHRAHWKRKGETEFAITTKRERFRVPCECERGDAWIEARRRGEELPADSDAPER